ncbi:hypothetical protein K8P10_001969 [Leucobacter sp. Psy1]|uniref:hypothetical protein n=1 Tax=Leucobacter sp. Psy1 TaxID=2875729 RepID=UPI001CD33FC4|nr:hypothetical protein [Leucobacter sp. Psy1]UBH06458.1 hypothetical protein K8P10_001969 [Leucobacter sp. Psy1]
MVQEEREVSESVEASIASKYREIGTALARTASVAAAAINALGEGFKLAIDAERRYTRVLACIRAGHASDITDEEALEVLWSRYGNDATALAAALGDWYTARAHRELDELRGRYGMSAWPPDGQTDGSLPPGQMTQIGTVPAPGPHLHFTQLPKPARGGIS